MHKNPGRSAPLFFLQELSHASGIVALYVEAFRFLDNATECAATAERCDELIAIRSLLHTIAEPIARPPQIHEYHITPFSLGTAISAGLTATEVVSFLFRHAHNKELLLASNQTSKKVTTKSTIDVKAKPNSRLECCDEDGNVFGGAIVGYITGCMNRYNKVSIFLKDSKTYLEIVEEALVHEILRDARVRSLCKTSVVNGKEKVTVKRISGAVAIDPVAHKQDEEVAGTSQAKPLLLLDDDEEDEVNPQSSVDNNYFVVSSEGTANDEHRDQSDGERILPVRTEAEAEEEAERQAARAAETAEIMCATFRIELADHSAGREMSEMLCRDFGYPIYRMYEFMTDASARTINISLKPQCKPRPYQLQAVEAALNADASAARSGVLLLPCGAGKTLVGVLLASVVKKVTLIVCAGAVSVEQWKHQLLDWANLAPWTDDATHAPRRGGGIRQGKPTGGARVSCLTGKLKDDINDEETDVVITTYTMLSVALQHVRRVQRRQQTFQGTLEPVEGAQQPAVDRRASAQSKRKRNPKESLFSTMWGLVILDEVHMAPAEVFRDSIRNLSFRCVVGLTATFVREDHRIADVFHTVGPKLFDVSWEELCRLGYLANVVCVEVHVPMTVDFMMEYHNRLRVSKVEPPTTTGRVAGGGEAALRRNPMLCLIASANPNKFYCVQELVLRHQHAAFGASGGGERLAKILVFCDHIPLLKELASFLEAPIICGATSHKERLQTFSEFQTTSRVNVICISRVGDVSVNLPSANVVIQVSSHGGSRRQEAQRLGRILRPKEAPPSSTSHESASHKAKAVDSYFYSIVSDDTVEVNFAAHRTEFLINQGYTCRLVTFVPPTTEEAQEQCAAPPLETTGVGDVQQVKQEQMFGELEKRRILRVAGHTPAAPLVTDNGGTNGSSPFGTVGGVGEGTRLFSHPLALSRKRISKEFQIRLLSVMISKWELDFQSRSNRLITPKDEGGSDCFDDDEGVDVSSEEEAPRPVHRRKQQRTVAEIKEEAQVGPPHRPAPSATIALAELTTLGDGIVYCER